MPNYPQPATTTANKDSTTYPLTSPRGKSSLMGRLFTLATIGEAATWGGLLIGMFLKYVTETTALGVTVFGALHGGMFIIYLVVAILAGLVLRWPFWAFAIAILAAIPPLVTIPVEILLRKKGLLTTRPRWHQAALKTSR